MQNYVSFCFLLKERKFFSDNYFGCSELLFKIQHGMKVAIKTTDALDQAKCMLAEQQAKVKAYEEMRQFLQVLTTIH